MKHKYRSGHRKGPHLANVKIYNFLNRRGQKTRPPTSESYEQWRHETNIAPKEFFFPNLSFLTNEDELERKTD